MATRNLNKVMLIGNLTRDTEVRYTPQGNAVASFVVATNREWKVNGEVKQVADFHNVVAWNKLAEICGQLLKKGIKVYIEGRLQTRNWEDTASGTKRYKTEVVVDDMIILSRKQSTEGEGSASGSAVVDVPSQDTETSFDDINFDDLGNLDDLDLDSKDEVKEEEKKEEDTEEVEEETKEE